VLERTLKWIKRRPAAAGLLAVSVLALIGLIAVWAYFTVQLQDEKEKAIKERNEAVTQEARATEAGKKSPPTEQTSRAYPRRGCGLS